MTQEKKKNVASWFLKTLWKEKKQKPQDRRGRNKVYYFTVRQHKEERETVYKVFSREYLQAGRSALEHYEQYFKNNTSFYNPQYYEVKAKTLPEPDFVLINRYDFVGCFYKWYTFNDDTSPIVEMDDMAEIMVYLERMVELEDIITPRERALASRFLIGLKVITMLYEKEGLNEQGIEEACDIMSKIVKRYDDLHLSY